MTGAWAVLGALAVASALGLWWRARQGKVLPIGPSSPELETLPSLVREALSTEPGTVTLIQLSTTFCAPCRHTRALLADLAAKTPGLRHREIDVTDQVEIAIRLGVRRTPTTIAFDTQGGQLLRIGGVPRRDALLAAVRPHLA